LGYSHFSREFEELSLLGQQCVDHHSTVRICTQRDSAPAGRCAECFALGSSRMHTLLCALPTRELQQRSLLVHVYYTGTGRYPREWAGRVIALDRSSYSVGQ
jgi:hypothetical protein